MSVSLPNQMTELMTSPIPMPIAGIGMPIAGIGSATLGWLMFILSVFLILLVLVQRGKGGGLTGALGGPGGQSAFGSKAGDTFTLITAISAIVWGLVCAVAMYSLGVPPATASDDEFSTDDTPGITSPAGESDTAGGLGGLEDLGSSLSLEPADTETATEAEASEDTSPDETGTPSAELTPKDPPVSETETKTDSNE